MAKLHIGLSGYDYKEWHGEGLLYSPEIKRTSFLKAYAEHFNALEANGTFQRIPSEATTTKWLSSVPKTFTYCPKMVQNVTHFKRLSEEAIGIAKEFMKALAPVENANQLGPVLLQLPPNFKRDDAKLERFLKELSGVKFGAEFRHESWNEPEVARLLEKYGSSFAAVETDDDKPQLIGESSFFFARLRKLTYSDAELKSWATTIRNKLDGGCDCYIFCRHKDTVAPWLWAFRIIELIGLD
jgi:uncharacterized protein YecE (DUF72 family)